MRGQWIRCFLEQSQISQIIGSKLTSMAFEEHEVEVFFQNRLLSIVQHYYEIASIISSSAKTTDGKEKMSIRCSESSDRPWFNHIHLYPEWYETAGPQRTVKSLEGSDQPDHSIYIGVPCKQLLCIRCGKSDNHET